LSASARSATSAGARIASRTDRSPAESRPAASAACRIGRAITRASSAPAAMPPTSPASSASHTPPSTRAAFGGEQLDGEGGLLDQLRTGLVVGGADGHRQGDQGRDDDGHDGGGGSRVTGPAVRTRPPCGGPAVRRSTARIRATSSRGLNGFVT
jgi:hypothetical protein